MDSMRACFALLSRVPTALPPTKRPRTSRRRIPTSVQGRVATRTRKHAAADAGRRAASASPRSSSPPAAATETAPADPSLHPLLATTNRTIVSLAVHILHALYANTASPWRRLWVLEVIARVPYFTFLCVNHLAETLGLGSDTVTARLRAHFAEADNEALHLAVMEALGGGECWSDRFVAQHVSLVYFWVGAVAYLVNPAAAYQFNELVEEHAAATYEKVLVEHEELLKKRAPVPLVAHEYYAVAAEKPRRVESMYDVIEAIRDDELSHADDLGRYSRESVGSVPWRR